MTTGGRIWIVTPVYFDVPAFMELHRRIVSILGGHPDDRARLEFIVIDDSAGQDPDIAQVRPLACVRVVDPPFNLGHQRAIVHGLRSHAAAFEPDDVIVTMDSDGEDQPEDLPRLIDALAHGADPRMVVLATRTQREETLVFRFFYRIFRAAFRLLTGVVVRSGNYVAFRGSLVPRVIDHPSFDLCYSSTWISLNLPIVAVPCARGHRYAGRSRMNFSRLVLHGLSMLMPFTDRIAIRALLALVGLAALSLVGAFVVVLVKILTPAAIPGWATYSLLLLALLVVVSAVNVVVLLVIFSQVRGSSLGVVERLGQEQDEPARIGMR